LSGKPDHHQIFGCSKVTLISFNLSCQAR